MDLRCMSAIRHDKHRDGRGFTIIEMMVVIAVIVTLVGLLVPTIGAVRESARRRITRTLIDGIAAGLQRYREDFDEFPASTVADLGDTAEDDSLYKYLCGPGGKGLTKVVGVDAPDGTPALRQRIEPYISPPAECLRKDGAKIFIVDSWGERLVYLNSKAYTDRQKQGNPGYVDDGKCMNPSSFDLYSTGTDRQKDPDPLNLVDDITNWK